MFQYGIEGWKKFDDSTLRIFAEYADLTSYWWTNDPRTRNISYAHHIYKDGYRYRGRPIGHWADQDSKILTLGSLFLDNDGIGWGAKVRSGKLNEDGIGSNSVSNGFTTHYLSIDFFNSRFYSKFDMSVFTSIGLESLDKRALDSKDEGLSAFLSISRSF